MIFFKNKFYRSLNVTFHEEQFPSLDNGSRSAIVLPFPGNDSVGAVTDSVGVNNAPTSETDANEVLPTLEGRYHRQGELLLQFLILVKKYHQHLVLIMCKWRFKILQST